MPGLRGQDFAVEAHDPARLAEARERVRELAATHRIAVIIPMDWDGPEGILNVAFVISADGEILGCQTKNQIAPEEDAHYVPGRGREMFEVNGVPFAISICHEGWRYPESVRWGAVRGAAVVFHPHHAGNEVEGITVESFGAASSPCFEIDSAHASRGARTVAWHRTPPRLPVISGWIRTLPTGTQYLVNLRSQVPMPDSSSALRIALSGISSVADFTYTNSATTRSSSQ